MADFTIKRGARKTWTITVPDDGSGLTFTGATIYVAVRASSQQAAVSPPTDDSDAIIHDSTVIGGLVITDAVLRIFDWLCIEAATKNQPVGYYWTDFKWIPAGESEPRSLGQEDPYTFQIKQDEVRGV